MAGHVEITYYVLMVTAVYAAWRLAALRYRLGALAAGPAPAAWLAVMVALGLALGAVQLVPLYELVTQSFREGSASLRRCVTGPGRAGRSSPSCCRTSSATPRITPISTSGSGPGCRSRGTPAASRCDTIVWGVKNYVEGGNYLGLGTLILAASRRDRSLAAGALPPQPGEHRGRPPALRRPGDPRRCCSPSAPRSMPCSTTGCRATASCTRPSAGSSPTRSAWPRWPASGWIALLAWREERASARPRLRRLDASRSPCGLPRTLGGLAALAGAGALVVVAASAVVPAPFIALGERLLAFSSRRVTLRFADGAMAWSYEAAGLRALRRDGAADRRCAVARHPAHRCPRPSAGCSGPLALVVAAAPRSLAGRPPLQPGDRPQAARFHAAGADLAAGAARAGRSVALHHLRRARREAAQRQLRHALRAGGCARVRLDHPQAVRRLHASRIQPQEGELLYNRIGPIVTRMGRAAQLRPARQPAAGSAGRAVRRLHAAHPQRRLPARSTTAR